MAESTRTFGKGELIGAVVIALAAGFFLGTVVMELRQPAKVQAVAQAPAEQAAAGGDGHDHSAEQARISELEIALATRAGDQAGWVELGNLYFDTHQAKKSIAAYEKAIALGEQGPDVWTDLGIMQREDKRLKEALASFDQALKRNPRHENALYNRGVVLLHDTGDKAGAAAAWGKLLEVNPNAKTPDGRPLAGIVAELKRG